MIIRSGEIPEKFYIIKSGKVEIISTDKRTRIAILEEGAYFGEIALLVTSLRTANVRALTNCIFVCLDREYFVRLMEIFPSQKEFLMKIAKQRLMTSTTEDVLVTEMVPPITTQVGAQNSTSQFFPDESFSAEEINASSENSIDVQTKKPEIKQDRRASNRRSRIFKLSGTILEIQNGLFSVYYNKFHVKEFSQLYFYWFYFISFTFIIVIFYTPYTLIFDIEPQVSIGIDSYIAIVYLLDIIFHAKTRPANFRLIFKFIQTLFERQNYKIAKKIDQGKYS